MSVYKKILIEEDPMPYQVVCDKKTAFGKTEPTILVGVSPFTTYPVTQNPIFDELKDAEKFQKELEEWAEKITPSTNKSITRIRINISWPCRTISGS